MLSGFHGLSYSGKKVKKENEAIKEKNENAICLIGIFGIQLLEERWIFLWIEIKWTFFR